MLLPPEDAWIEMATASLVYDGKLPSRTFSTVHPRFPPRDGTLGRTRPLVRVDVVHTVRYFEAKPNLSTVVSAQRRSTGALGAHVSVRR